MAVNVQVDVPDLRRVAQDIRRVDKDASNELKREFRRIGNRVLKDARNNARSNLPSRLASKGAMSLVLGVQNDRVYIKFNNTGPGGRGQIARVFEIGSQRNRGYIKHPAWPKPGVPRSAWTWLPTGSRQLVRPSVQPALDDNEEWVKRQLKHAIERAMRKASILGGVKFRA